MAFSVYAELDGVTVGASELSIVSGTTSLATDTTDGTFVVLVDLSGMQKGDEYCLRVYEKVEETGGTKRLLHRWCFMGVQASNVMTPAMLLMHGWDATLQKIAGGDRAFDANIRRVA